MLFVVVGAIAFSFTVYSEEFFGTSGIFNYKTVVDTYEREVERLGKPTNLRLPIDTSSIPLGEGMLSPFGVVGGGGEDLPVGNMGIDIPLVRGAQIYAPQKGVVVSIEPSGDGRGSELLILVGASINSDEGWGFLFENVEPIKLSPGDSFVRGEYLAKSVLPQNEATHIQMSYFYEGYARSRNHTCWVDLLAPGDRTIWDNFFRMYSTNQHFIDSWTNAVEKNGVRRIYAGLMDETLYPSGVSACYKPGTDVRI